MILAELLRFEGHDVATSLSGSEAVELAASTKPDVVLLDIGLPGMDGYEVARHIRSRSEAGSAAGAHLPQLVAITGYGREDDRERTRAAGFAAHLVKPISFEALHRTLADLG